jgi:uncharacterized protein YjbJ (UPF0337 family)
MKPFLWILAGITTGIAAYVILNALSPPYATGSDDVDDAANKAAWWGTKQRVTGRATGLAGKMKENVGRVTGDDRLTAEGGVDQVAGAVKNAAGQTAAALSDTARELNR